MTRVTVRRLGSAVAVAVAVLVTPAAWPTGLAESGTTRSDAAPAARHVPSPAWEDQVIYFVMTDRFNDGNEANNDHGAGEYDPEDGRKYSGGDFVGITERLDYIEELGATSVWITPPVKNQWWDPLVDYGGYHGYWASDFGRLDPHVGTLSEYRELAEELHRRDMYLIQDVVVNHTGNFFTYDDGAYDPGDPTAGFTLNTESVPVSAPELFPLGHNDARTAAGREANVFNWTPDIEDESVDEQRLTYQLFDLDDLNTENPVVRETLRAANARWIREVGVDAFRFDTAIYVSHDFWHELMHAEDTPTPGLFDVARQTGRDDFLAFGEAFVGSEPGSSAGERRVASYLGTAERPELNSMINFPLYFTIGRVFAEGRPTSLMEERLEAIDEVFDRPERLPVFIDNHDTSRFLTRTNEAGFRQALMFMMTVPGIPVIYQGTEQAMTGQRSAMFEGGYGSGGRDRFDTQSETFAYLQELIELRRSDSVFTRGDLEVLASSERGAGTLVYRRSHEGREAIVVMNTAPRRVLLNAARTGLGAGRLLELRAGSGAPEGVATGPDGTLTLELPPRASWVFSPAGEAASVPGSDTTISLSSDLAGGRFAEDVTVRGSVSRPGVELALVVNGNLGRAERFAAGDDGSFETTLPLSGFPAGESTNTISVYAPAAGVATRPVEITTVVRSRGRATTVHDLRGDDVGPLPTSGYAPPGDEYDGVADVVRTTVSEEDGDLRVTVKAARLAADSRAPNGFARVRHHVFLDLPGVQGTDVLPQLGASAPDGFAWDLAGVHDGRRSSVHLASRADASSYGEPVAGRSAERGAVPVAVDADAGTLTFAYPAAILGERDSLVGTRVYVATWPVGEGGELLPLGPDSQGPPVTASGEAGARILDDTAIVPLEDRVQITAPDPAGDDHGPSGEYELPTDTTFGEQMDLRRVSAVPVGSNLVVELDMAEITTVWGPPNGFDHVLFHVFIDLPGTGEGTTVLPGINATAPSGFAWDYLGFHEGWNNRLYSNEGAGADSYGTVVTPTPEIAADEEAGTVTVTYGAQALGNPENLDEAAVYVTTWDWDGPQADYRGLVAAPTQWNFGGGDDETDPLIMDSALVGMSPEFTPPEPGAREVVVRFVVTDVPDSTPEDATLYLAGPFNNWTPDHESFAFTERAGRYVLEWEFDAGSELAYRITRGSWNNQELLDPDDRFANRTTTVPQTDEHTVEIEIGGWWSPER